MLDLDYEEDAARRLPVELALRDKELLLEQIVKDCKFLALHGVMDYSLFVCRAKQRYFTDQ